MVYIIFTIIYNEKLGINHTSIQGEKFEIAAHSGVFGLKHNT